MNIEINKPENRLDAPQNETENKGLSRYKGQINASREKLDNLNPDMNGDAIGSDSFKRKLQYETGWSNEIINYIDSPEQSEIYKKAGLRQSTINGRDCLIKRIDMDYIDEKTGFTNRELMAKGRSPIDSISNEKIELHHMGQSYDAPFAELKSDSEHGDGNHTILHPKTSGSWRNDETLEKRYRKEKVDYWKYRSRGESL